MENYGKLWKIIDNYEQLRKIMDNYGKLWKISQCTLENYGHFVIYILYSMPYFWAMTLSP